MTWVPLLLADRSPCLRLLTLRDLLLRQADDPEMHELQAISASDPLVTELIHLQQPDGSWTADGHFAWGDSLRVTSGALARLGYLGFGPEFAPVARGAEFIFSHQCPDGSFPLPRDRETEDDQAQGYSMVPLQTALPLRGLAMCGYATDPRAEHAYDWLLAQRLSDGAWPTGMAAGVHGYVAGYRRMSHSRWGCRSNTTGALICIARHPQRRNSPEARQALDLLLGRETREQHTLGFEMARLIGLERTRGFFTFFARFDLAFILDLCWRIGATRDDPRVAELESFIVSLQGAYGLWSYPDIPQASRWVTFDILRSLMRLDDSGAWLSREPRTPFKPYAKKLKRY